MHADVHTWQCCRVESSIYKSQEILQLLLSSRTANYLSGASGPSFGHYVKPLPQDAKINWRAIGFPKMAFVTIIFLCLALFLLVFSAGRIHAQKILRATPLAPLASDPALALPMGLGIPGSISGLFGDANLPPFSLCRENIIVELLTPDQLDLIWSLLMSMKNSISVALLSKLIESNDAGCSRSEQLKQTLGSMTLHQPNSLMKFYINSTLPVHLQGPAF